MCPNEITKCVRLLDYKVWQQWITKCDKMDYKVCLIGGLQSVLGVGLQSVTKWITKCGRVDYKVRKGL